MFFKKYIVLMSMLGVIIGHEDDDGKYRPDAIPVWEHERQDYTFSYGVKDLHTGDVKNQWEKKVGDTVHGHYTVLEPDGSLRIVHYTADEKNGFNAVVKHEGPSYHPVTIPSSHSHQTHSYYATSAPPIKPKGNRITKFTSQATPKPILEDYQGHQGHTGQVEGTRSVNIEPEMEAIDAYLYIPSQGQSQGQNQGDYKVSHYELVSDDQYQHFVNYDLPQNHKPRYSAIQQNSKIKPNYDLLSPVTIDLTKYEFDYNNNNNNYKGVFVEPEIETGFKPVPKTKTQDKPHIPNTFTTNKKPVTTPGLKTFASDQHLPRPPMRGPVIFPKRSDKDRIVQFSSNSPGKNRKNGHRYRKHVAYVPDDY